MIVTSVLFTLIIVTVTVMVACIVVRRTKRKHTVEFNTGILHVVIYSLCTSIDVVPQSTDNEYVLIYICVCYIIVFSYVSHNVQTLSAVNNTATVTVSTPTHENPYYFQYPHEVYILIQYILYIYYILYTVYTVGTQFDILCRCLL